MAPVWLWACCSTEGWGGLSATPLPRSPGHLPCQGPRWRPRSPGRLPCRGPRWRPRLPGCLPCRGWTLRGGLLQGRLPEQCGGTGRVPGWVFRLVVRGAGRSPRKAVGCPGDLSLGSVPPGPQHGGEAASRGGWEIGAGEAWSEDARRASPPSRDRPPHSVLPGVVGHPLCSTAPRRPVEGGRGGQLTVTPRPPLPPLSSLASAGHPGCADLIPRLR